MKFCKKKWVSCLLALAMIVSLVPTMAFAAVASSNTDFSAAFSAPLTDGKLVFHYVKPSADTDTLWLIAEDFWFDYPDFSFSPDGFTQDFSKVELCMFEGTENEERHVVDVVWAYDKAVLQTAQSFIEKFPEDRSWFAVSDLELVNYWAYHDPTSDEDSLANYSGELKSILGNSNFSFTIEIRAGSDEPFYTERLGSAKLIHNGTVYFASGMFGARAEHALYVPADTADTKDALAAAAQKRIDEYIGDNVVKITAADQTVTEYYNSMLAQYDSDLAAAQEQLAAAQATLDAELAKEESQQNGSVISECQFTIMRCEMRIQSIPQDKQYFAQRFAEGGDLQFLKKAAGDFLFTVEVIATEETYSFVIIKDDTKLAAPSYTTVDLGTNISVTAGSAAIPLDTVVEAEMLAGGEEYERIFKILDVDVHETYDIKLYSNSLNRYVTTLENGKFEVALPIPEKLKGKDLVVYYVDQNGRVIEHEVTVKDNAAVFTTDHFSIYTLAAKSGHTQHSGGTATCCEKAVCDECQQAYGELNPANHAGGTEIRNAKEATQTEKGYTGDTYCKGCGAKIADGKEIPAKGASSSVDAGEHSRLWLWAVIGLVSGGLLLGTVVFGKKKKVEQEK